MEPNIAEMGTVGWVSPCKLTNCRRLAHMGETAGHLQEAPCTTPSAGDLRELPRVPLRGEGSCGGGVDHIWSSQALLLAS